jgi:transposase
MALTAGQVSDHIGAKIVYPSLPSANVMIADKGYDSDEYRSALKAKGIDCCIPPRKGRRVMHHYCKTQYKQRQKVENMFGKLKDWRRIANRYDRCANFYLVVTKNPATLVFWTS